MSETPSSSSSSPQQNSTQDPDLLPKTENPTSIQPSNNINPNESKPISADDISLMSSRNLFIAVGILAEEVAEVLISSQTDLVTINIFLPMMLLTEEQVLHHQLYREQKCTKKQIKQSLTKFEEYEILQLTEEGGLTLYHFDTHFLKRCLDPNLRERMRLYKEYLLGLRTRLAVHQTNIDEFKFCEEELNIKKTEASEDDIWDCLQQKIKKKDSNGKIIKNIFNTKIILEKAIITGRIHYIIKRIQYSRLEEWCH
jgi:hypothetical protein